MKKLYMMLLQKAIMSKKRKLRTLVKELSRRNRIFNNTHDTIEIYKFMFKNEILSF